MNRPKRQRKQLEPSVLLINVKKRSHSKKGHNVKPLSKKVTSLQTQISNKSSATDTNINNSDTFIPSCINQLHFDDYVYTNLSDMLITELIAKRMLADLNYMVNAIEVFKQKSQLFCSAKKYAQMANLISRYVECEKKTKKEKNRLEKILVSK